MQSVGPMRGFQTNTAVRVSLLGLTHSAPKSQIGHPNSNIPIRISQISNRTLDISNRMPQPVHSIPKIQRLRRRSPIFNSHFANRTSQIANISPILHSQLPHPNSHISRRKSQISRSSRQFHIANRIWQIANFLPLPRLCQKHTT